MKILRSHYIGAMYEGTGLYCSVQPIRESLDYFWAVCKRAESALGIPATTKVNLHSTIVCSETSLSLDKQRILGDEGVHADYVFIATVKRYQHFAGHNGKGYLVAELVSPMMAEYHHWLRDRFSLAVTFDEYMPHVTIVTDAYTVSTKVLDQLCAELNQGPYPRQIFLSGMRVENKDFS